MRYKQEQNLNKTLKVIKDKFEAIDFIIMLLYIQIKRIKWTLYETSKNNFINSLFILFYSH